MFTITLTPIITVAISGFFGLAVAVLTWKLAMNREKGKMILEQKTIKHKEKEELYVSMLASFDKVIRLTSINGKYESLLNELTLNRAKSTLLAPKKITEQSDLVSDKLFEWSYLANLGRPTKVGDTDFGMVSNKDFEYQDKAKDFYPKMMEELQKLTQLMKDDLSKINHIENKA